MGPESLFSLALGIVPPWEVIGVGFSQERGRLDIQIDFARGSTFACPVCGAQASVHDTTEKTWRHLNFLVLRCFKWVRVI